jgi:hypothetical protein
MTKRFNEEIHEQKWYAYRRLVKGTMCHVAHYDRGRGTRMYICSCSKSIRISKEKYITTGRRIVRSNFQERSKWNIR